MDNPSCVRSERDRERNRDIKNRGESEKIPFAGNAISNNKDK